VDHIIVLGEEHLRRILKNYAAYYNTVRTHRSLHKPPKKLARRRMVSAGAMLLDPGSGRLD
jgi:hypothetical protein